MNLLQVIDSLDPATGGPAEHLRALTPVLRKNGHKCDIACFDPPDAEWLVSWEGGVFPFGPCASKFGYSGRFTGWLKDNAGNYDAVVVRGLWQYSSFAVWKVLSGGRIPYFVFPHGMLDPWFKRAYPLKHIKKYIYWLAAGYRILRDAETVFFTSEQEKKLARGSFRPYKCREKVVKYGTVPPPADKETLRDRFASRFPGVRGKRIFLFLGRVHEKKGCDMLVKAFSRVCSGIDDAVLVIAGPGEERSVQKLKGLVENEGVSDKVFFPGMLRGDEKWGAFYSSELFILPSHQENFGIAVVEALATETPVLITSKVNIWEEILNEGAGIICDDDTGALTQALGEWLGIDTDVRAGMKENALKGFRKHFEIHAAAESLIAEIRKHRKRSP